MSGYKMNTQRYRSRTSFFAY